MISDRSTTKTCFSALIGIGCGVNFASLSQTQGTKEALFPPRDQTEDALVAGAQLMECFRLPEGWTEQQPGAHAALTLSSGLENKHTANISSATCFRVEQVKHEKQY